MSGLDIEDLKTTARNAIIAAFPVSPHPDASLLRNDHCEECQQLSTFFSRKPWTDLALADLARNPSPSLLTHAAFQYYLPAMMLHSIDAGSELDCFPDFLVNFLSPTGDKLSEFTRERLTGFSSEQRGYPCFLLRYFETNDCPEQDVNAYDKGNRRVLFRAIKFWSAPPEYLA